MKGFFCVATQDVEADGFSSAGEEVEFIFDGTGKAEKIKYAGRDLFPLI